MCTVTIVPIVGLAGDPVGVRVASNRDESHQRPPASTPVKVSSGDRQAIMPIDPSSGGTWIAVSDAGLVMTLLNRNPHDMRGAVFSNQPSRGRIIPSLFQADSLDQACDLASAMAPGRYAPFRIVITDVSETAEVAMQDHGVTVTRRQTRQPIMFTSSGLGDAVVEPPRRQLFDQWFGDDPKTWPASQDAFHRHQWDDHPQWSVCMSRQDARTVSLTVVELTDDSMTMIYDPKPRDNHVDQHILTSWFDGAPRP